MEWAYSMETIVVRDSYREFEKKASGMGYTRQKEETIREWFKRQNWEVSDRFTRSMMSFVIVKFQLTLLMGSGSTSEFTFYELFQK